MSVKDRAALPVMDEDGRTTLMTEHLCDRKRPKGQRVAKTGVAGLWGEPWRKFQEEGGGWEWGRAYLLEMVRAYAGSTTERLSVMIVSGGEGEGGEGVQGASGQISERKKENACCSPSGTLFFYLLAASLSNWQLAGGAADEKSERLRALADIQD